MPDQVPEEIPEFPSEPEWNYETCQLDTTAVNQANESNEPIGRPFLAFIVDRSTQVILGTYYSTALSDAKEML